MTLENAEGNGKQKFSRVTYQGMHDKLEAKTEF